MKIREEIEELYTHMDKDNIIDVKTDLINIVDEIEGELNWILVDLENEPDIDSAIKKINYIKNIVY